jgi:thioredoxin-related protein
MLAMDEIRVPRIEDFSRAGERARKEGRLLVVLVSQHHCPYCEKIKAEIIRPMLKARDFGDSILLGEILIDQGERLVDFQGRQVPAADFAHRYGVFVTPTLLFLGPDGRELAKQMVGINTVEMYFYYVSESIREGLRRLRRRIT